MKNTLRLATLLVLGVTMPVAAGAGLPTLANVNLGPYTAVIRGDSAQLRTGVNTISLDIVGTKQPESASLHLMGPNGEIVEVPLKPLLVLGGGDAHGGHEGTEHGETGHDDAANAAASAAQGDSGHQDAVVPAANHADAAPHGSDGHVDAVPHEAAPATPAPHGSAGHDMSTMFGGHEGMDMGYGQAAAVPEPESEPMEDHAAPLDLSSATTQSSATTGTTFQTSVRGRAKVGSLGTWTAQLSVKENGRTYSAEVPVVVAPGGPNKAYVGVTSLLMMGSLAYGAVRRRTATPGKGKR